MLDHWNHLGTCCACTECHPQTVLTHCCWLRRTATQLDLSREIRGSIYWFAHQTHVDNWGMDECEMCKNGDEVGERKITICISTNIQSASFCFCLLWLKLCLTKYLCSLTLITTWWRHQMETFSALLAICAEKSPVTGEFSTQRPVTRSFDVFSDLRLNKRLSKHSRGWWFETPASSLLRHCNDFIRHHISRYPFLHLLKHFVAIYH